MIARGKVTKGSETKSKTFVFFALYWTCRAEAVNKLLVNNGGLGNMGGGGIGGGEVTLPMGSSVTHKFSKDGRNFCGLEVERKKTIEQLDAFLGCMIQSGRAKDLIHTG